MRFHHKTVELVLLIALTITLVLMYPAASYIRGHNFYRFFSIIFFGFSLDYLTRGDVFFQSKYIRVSQFGLGILILAIAFKILHLVGADYLLIAAALVIPVPYVVYTIDKPKFHLMSLVNSIIICLLMGTMLTSLLHFPIAETLQPWILPATALAVIIQFLNLRGKLPKSVS